MTDFVIISIAFVCFFIGFAAGRWSKRNKPHPRLTSDDPKRSNFTAVQQSAHIRELQTMNAKTQLYSEQPTANSAFNRQRTRNGYSAQHTGDTSNPPKED